MEFVEALSKSTSRLIHQPLIPYSVHIYFLQTDAEEVKFATELWERIRRECMYSPTTCPFL